LSKSKGLAINRKVENRRPPSKRAACFIFRKTSQESKLSLISTLDFARRVVMINERIILFWFLKTLTLPLEGVVACKDISPAPNSKINLAVRDERHQLDT
jgi:hypothetical protein